MNKLGLLLLTKPYQYDLISVKVERQNCLYANNMHMAINHLRDKYRNCLHLDLFLVIETHFTEVATIKCNKIFTNK